MPASTHLVSFRIVLIVDWVAGYNYSSLTFRFSAKDDILPAWVEVVDEVLYWAGARECYEAVRQAVAAWGELGCTQAWSDYSELMTNKSTAAGVQRSMSQTRQPGALVCT